MAKYNSIENIPAKLFFEVLNTRDYTLLVSEQENEDLEEVFTAIYDDFFVKIKNPQAKIYLEMTWKINFLSYKLETIRQVMHFLWYENVIEEHRLKLLNALEKGCGIYIDKSAKFADEVLRVLQVECGIIENDLTMATLELQNTFGKQGTEKFDFYKTIVGLSNIHNRNIEDNIVLAMYVAIENSAKDIINSQKK
jgi:hypothetical protein